MQWVHQHALLAEVEREWEVGMRLNQLAYKDGSLPGFMGVGAGPPPPLPPCFRQWSLPRLTEASTWLVNLVGNCKEYSIAWTASTSYSLLTLLVPQWQC